MLHVESLEKSFDGFMAVNGATLTVEKGDVVAVIGPNGAGKTTLFNLISGQLPPTAGKIWFKEENIAGLAAHRVCRKGISRSYQVVNIFNRLTIFENVQVSRPLPAPISAITAPSPTCSLSQIACSDFARCCGSSFRRASRFFPGSRRC